MKILFAVNCISGGASNVIQVLALHYQQQGHEVDLLLYDGIDVSSRYDLSNINIIELPKLMPNRKLNSFMRIFYQIKNVRSYLKKENPDLIISFLDNVNTLTSLANWKIDIPIIVSERNNTLVLKPKFPWDFLRKVAYKRVDIIAVQCSIFSNFYKGYFKNKTRIIPNPIVSPRDRHEVKNNHNINIVSVGRLVEQKNFKWLIESFGKIIQQVPEAKLTIYGRGEKQEELRKQINDMGLHPYINLAGYTTDIHEALAQSDIYVMTSLQEGFPNSLSEAMAVGLPVVALRCHDGLQDIISNNENGFLIEMNSQKEFIEKVVQLAQDSELRKKIGNKAQLVSEKYSEENIYRLWDETIHQAMRGKG
ncbi:glycosyltransferase [Priestia sp. D3YE.R1]|uniref:glycosyltransferase n=1 Tax=Priestia sp. D3YE.R1 TaxID=3400416 RepID=UPI003BA192C7